VVVLAGYLVAATLFALRTPAWQNPDEPAHYNNIAFIAQEHRLPVLRMGDYNQAYQDALLAAGFPPDQSIAPLRYEAYQPPLYYLAATPLFVVTDGSLLALRLFNVLLGTVTLILIYLSLELVFPAKPLLTVGAVAFAAFLPMHIAMTAAVNNDGLAELLLAAAMLTLFRWMRVQFAAPLTASRQGTLLLLLLGVLLGLGMATKIYAYLALVLCAGVVWFVTWWQPHSGSDGRAARAPSWQSCWRGVKQACWVVLPALLLVLPLWLRNVQLYGAWDILGLQWHDQVVVGQPTTRDWIAAHGWMQYADRAFHFTFRSFWGVFGWLGVFMDERVYTLLFVFTGVIFFGLLWALVRFICGRPEADMDRFQFWVLGLLVMVVFAVFASYLWYNAKFVQHQGRYLFWGMLAISTLVALGWREVMQPLQGKVTGFLLGLLAMTLAATNMVVHTHERVTVGLMGGMALLLLIQPYLLSGVVDSSIIGAPVRIQSWLGHPRLRPVLAVGRVLIWATPFLALWLLDLAIPFWYIGPQLGR
jgi:hypothetical protein